jgi:hypothetical protein
MMSWTSPLFVISTQQGNVLFSHRYRFELTNTTLERDRDDDLNESIDSTKLARFAINLCSLGCSHSSWMPFHFELNNNLKMLDKSSSKVIFACCPVRLVNDQVTYFILEVPSRGQGNDTEGAFDEVKVNLLITAIIITKYLGIRLVDATVELSEHAQAAIRNSTFSDSIYSPSSYRTPSGATRYGTNDADSNEKGDNVAQVLTSLTLLEDTFLFAAVECCITMSAASVLSSPLNEFVVNTLAAYDPPPDNSSNQHETGRWNQTASWDMCFIKGDSTNDGSEYKRFPVSVGTTYVLGGCGGRYPADYPSHQVQRISRGEDNGDLLILRQKGSQCADIRWGLPAAPSACSSLALPTIILPSVSRGGDLPVDYSVFILFEAVLMGEDHHTLGAISLVCEMPIWAVLSGGEHSVVKRLMNPNCAPPTADENSTAYVRFHHGGKDAERDASSVFYYKNLASQHCFSDEFWKCLQRLRSLLSRIEQIPADLDSTAASNLVGHTALNKEVCSTPSSRIPRGVGKITEIEETALRDQHNNPYMQLLLPLFQLSKIERVDLANQAEGVIATDSAVVPRPPSAPRDSEGSSSKVPAPVRPGRKLKSDSDL